MVNRLYTDALGYRTYRLTKIWVWYDDDIGDELNKMTRKTVFEMKDRTFNGEDLMSIIALFTYFEAACDA